MKHLISFSFLFFFSLASYAFQWTDLWYTPDQQAQKYMQEKNFKKAQTTFEREDWAATAAYRAQNYQKAAKIYAKLQNEEGYYNLGNALAQLHQYPEAIKAYDQALALNPKHQDAKFNRDLVERLMKNQQNKEQQNKDQQNKEQQNKEQQDKEQQDKEQQNKEQQDKEQQNKEQQDKEQQDKEQQDKEQQDKEQQDKEQQDKEQQNKDQRDKEQQNKEQRDKEQQNKEQQDKEQQNKEQQDKEQQNKEQQDKEQQNKEQQDKEQQDKEQQQAKEQWLRLIPDDPGGLLREKFLRDHLRRQRGWVHE